VSFECGTKRLISQGAGFDVYEKSWTNDILFSTSKGEVYIKTEGGKKKLDAYGIQEELRGRLNGF
jgi:hypothetical protein